MLKKISTVLLVVASVAAGSWLIWWLLKHYWAPILFFSYLTVGVVMGFGVSFSWRNKGPREMFLEAVSPTPSWRRGLVWAVTSLMFALTWPALLVNGFALLINGFIHRAENLERRAGPYYTAIYSLHPLDGIMAITSMALVIAIYVVDLSSSGRLPYSREVALLVFFQLVVRHLYYAVDRLPLPVRLRRSPGNAYLKFLSIAVFDFCSLVLANVGLFYWEGEGLPSLASLEVVVIDMLRFRKVQAIMAGQPVGLMDVAVTVSGALYYVTLLTTIFRFKEFRRNDEDLIEIASGYVALGRYNEAFRYIARIQAPSVNSHRVKAIAYLGVNQIEKAWGSVRAAEELETNGLSDTEYQEKVFLILLRGAVLYALPLSHARALVQKSVSLSIPDFTLLNGVATVKELAQIELKGWWSLLNGKDYQLTRAWFMLEEGEFDKALESLKTTCTQTPAEEVIRRIMILKAQMPPWASLEEKRITFASWAQENLIIIGEQINRVKEDSRKLSLIFNLQKLNLDAEGLASERSEEIAFLVEELSQSISESSRKLVEVSERFLKARFK